MKYKVWVYTCNTMNKLGSERTYLAKLYKDQKFNEQIRINK